MACVQKMKALIPIALLLLLFPACRGRKSVAPSASRPSTNATQNAAPTKPVPSVSAMDAEEYCRKVDVASLPKITFGRICLRKPDDLNAPLSCSWKQFTDEGEWQHWTEADGNDNYGAAFVWLRDGKVAQANFTFQTPSYDWANLANYCFWPNGIVASAETTLNDLNSDVSVHRVRLYSPDGAQLKTEEAARVLSTKRPIRIPEEIIEAERNDTSNSGFRNPSYKSTAELPFANPVPPN